MDDFCKAIEALDISKIIQFPKSDIHSHAGRCGNVKCISKWTGKSIPLPPTKFSSLSDMQAWYCANIRNLVSGKEGQIMRWKAGFKQVQEDNIKVLTLSFSIAEIELVGGIEKFMEILKEFNERIAPNTIFLPELTFDRACNVEKENDILDKYLEPGFFKSIDICCDEFAQSIRNFIPLYRKAEQYGLRLKAHVGEFGTADDVMEAVEVLGLAEVHHGIAAAKSKKVTRWLADNRIQLNICPTSNVMLNVVSSYSEHPIGYLYHEGVRVTINTDDLLIFNQSVSEEYINLFKANVLTAEELNQIRAFGLESSMST